MSRRRSAALAILAVVGFVVGFTILGVRWAPLHRQILLSTTRQPTPYTELYFSSPPANDGASFGSLRAEFTIVNHLGRTNDYPVDVRLAAGGTTTSLQSETLAVDAGASVRQPVTFAAPVGDYTLTVAIRGGNSIHYTYANP